MKLIKQRMGTLPTERLSPALPFNHVMLDIFGPYMVLPIKHLYQRDQQLLEAELKMLGMDLDIQGSPRVIDFIDKFKSHLAYSQYYYPLLEQLSHDVLLLPATNNSIERFYSEDSSQELCGPSDAEFFAFHACAWRTH